jgi:hypothetical protein
MKTALNRIATAALTFAFVLPAIAQDAEQNKLLAKRAAEADAYRKLAETIKGIEINSETYVRDFVTESDIIESEMDEFIKGVRLGGATYYEDGTCEVEAEVTIKKLVEHLKELHTRHYQGSRVVGTDFDQIERRYDKQIIKVTGMGAPRPDLPPNLPQGVADHLGGPPPVARPTTYPPIWAKVAPQGKLMAAQAARRDAQRKLLERIMGVRINSNTLVRDFVTEYDEISTQAEGLVVGSEEIKRFYHYDELIVEVTMAVPTEQVIRTITELHTRHYQGNRVTGTDISKVRESIKRKTFEATGSGVPNKRFVSSGGDDRGPTGYAPPDWSSTKLTAQGFGTDPEINTPQGRLRAIRAATSDARRNLIERIHGLQITSSTHVRDFVTERDEISSQVQSVIAGSVVESREADGEQAVVTVSVGGPDVWRVLHSEMIIEARQ